MSKRVLVCGGRDFNDRDFVFNKLYEYCEQNGFVTDGWPDDNWLPTITVIHGMAHGVDMLADEWAVINWCPVIARPADWTKHGRAAGPIRNQQMLDEDKPDVVLAFPGGKGTEHMKRIARNAGVEVVEFVLA